MRRALFIALLLLGLAALGLWVYGYLYLHGLACGFESSGSETCRINAPWTLRGEDATILLIIPGLIVAMLFGLAWWAKPPKR